MGIGLVRVEDRKNEGHLCSKVCVRNGKWMQNAWAAMEKTEKKGHRKLYVSGLCAKNERKHIRIPPRPAGVYFH